MSDHYTISLEHGKYTVIKYDTGGMEFLRHGEPWPAADDLKHTNVVRAMHDRIEELEMAIGQVLDGSLNPHGEQRLPDGMKTYDMDDLNLREWATILRKVLEQK